MLIFCSVQAQVVIVVAWDYKWTFEIGWCNWLLSIAVSCHMFLAYTLRPNSWMCDFCMQLRVGGVRNMASRSIRWGQNTHCMGVPTRTYSWAGGLRRIERRGGTEEVPVGEDPCLTKILSSHESLTPGRWEWAVQSIFSRVIHRFSEGGINRLEGWSRDSEKLANKNRERKIMILNNS